ncbi:hypothetical protein FZC78_10935 [Rossellomorea vietnamensis]|uniref:DUF4367 domain-containing protein n=1 Tax=Rossellomorea vietnamensis TaxID=218284 RepID=A0A5D4NT41_9BACI|nr:DUF4367 domain-containing protein [Rossellomorea vietnamensis]TYS17120.1 hypothetical protein FZC78_10935 [Rossellomorea vietnamensis]
MDEKELESLRKTMRAEFPDEFQFNNRMKEKVKKEIRKDSGMAPKKKSILGPAFSAVFVLGALALFIFIGGQELGFIGENNASYNEMFTYEPTEEISEINEEFKIPTKFPFEVTGSFASTPPTQNQKGKRYTIDFVSSNGQQLTLKVTSNEVIYTDDLEREEVRSGDFTGEYVVNENNVQILTWDDDNNHYSLGYMSENQESSLTKEDLINVAKSAK